MKYLVVAAHPDDEVLGAGASLYKLIKAGNEADICIMCGEVTARALKPDDDEFKADMKKSFDIIGFKNEYFADFPNIKMNNVDHLKLVQFIESAIIKSQPDVIITHHPGDVNNDHYQTALACQAAIRIFQRRSDVKPLSELWYMEVPSSTEWCVNSAVNKFDPNLFTEVGEDGVEMKIKALAAYKGVMRDYPHPRSTEALKGLAAYRGSQSGCNYAEAFQVAFKRVII